MLFLQSFTCSSFCCLFMSSISRSLLFLWASCSSFWALSTCSLFLFSRTFWSSGLFWGARPLRRKSNQWHGMLLNRSEVNKPPWQTRADDPAQPRRLIFTFIRNRWWPWPDSGLTCRTRCSGLNIFFSFGESHRLIYQSVNMIAASTFFAFSVPKNIPNMWNHIITLQTYYSWKRSCGGEVTWQNRRDLLHNCLDACSTIQKEEQRDVLVWVRRNSEKHQMLCNAPNSSKKVRERRAEGGAEDEDEARKCLRQSGNRDEVRVSRERPMNCKASGGIRDAQKRERRRGKKKRTEAIS